MCLYAAFCVNPSMTLSAPASLPSLGERRDYEPTIVATLPRVEATHGREPQPTLLEMLQRVVPQAVVSALSICLTTKQFPVVLSELRGHPSTGRWMPWAPPYAFFSSSADPAPRGPPAGFSLGCGPGGSGGHRCVLVSLPSVSALRSAVKTPLKGRRPLPGKGGA